MVLVPEHIWKQINVTATGERYATLKTARKRYVCCRCKENILPGQKYYSVVVVGSGVKGLIDEHKIHDSCLDILLGRAP